MVMSAERNARNEGLLPTWLILRALCFLRLAKDGWLVELTAEEKEKGIAEIREVALLPPDSSPGGLVIRGTTTKDGLIQYSLKSLAPSYEIELGQALPKSLDVPWDKAIPDGELPRFAEGKNPAEEMDFLIHLVVGWIADSKRESGKTKLTGTVCVPRSLGQFLGIELYVAQRALQKFERSSRLTEAGDLGPLEEADMAIRQAVIEATQEHIKKCEEALENLRQGEKSLACDLLDKRIKGLTNKAIRTLFKGELVGSSKVWQQIESLGRLKEK